MVLWCLIPYLVPPQCAITQGPRSARASPCRFLSGVACVSGLVSSYPRARRPRPRFRGTPLRHARSSPGLSPRCDIHATNARHAQRQLTRVQYVPMFHPGCVAHGARHLSSGQWHHRAPAVARRVHGACEGERRGRTAAVHTTYTARRDAAAVHMRTRTCVRWSTDARGGGCRNYSLGPHSWFSCATLMRLLTSRSGDLTSSVLALSALQRTPGTALTPRAHA
ncbi:hypothetical protein BD413DRAFT_19927 [Trametes elegans]|nr:hypothetical protein BD413DRAFT_19927 [Trametes elegans]